VASSAIAAGLVTFIVAVVISVISAAGAGVGAAGAAGGVAALAVIVVSLAAAAAMIAAAIAVIVGSRRTDGAPGRWRQNCNAGDDRGRRQHSHAGLPQESSHECD
jgi:hypothetical protein